MTGGKTDVVVWSAAAFAWLTLSNAALLLTVIATLVSISLGLMRWYDRVKYGPRVDD